MSGAVINQTVKTARQTLQGVNDAGAGDIFDNIPVILRSTIFYDASVVVTDQNFFQGSAGLDEQWQSKFFPSMTQAFKFNRLRVNFAMQFTASAVTRQVEYQKSFVELSRVEIRNEGNEVATVPLSELVLFKAVPANNVTGSAATYTQLVEKFNNWYELAKPIVIASGEQPDIKLRAASGFTTNAWTAATAPVLTKTANSGLTTADQGYYITLEMEGIKSKANKGATA